MFFWLKKYSIVNEVVAKSQFNVLISAMYGGIAPKAIWDDPFVQGFFMTLVAMHAHIITKGKLNATQKGSIIMSVGEKLFGDNSSAVLKYSDLELLKKLLVNPEYIRGGNVAEKIVLVSYGKGDFNNDPDLVNITRKDVETYRSAQGEIAGMLSEPPLSSACRKEGENILITNILFQRHVLSYIKQKYA